jgi:general secretion pathway protein M
VSTGAIGMPASQTPGLLEQLDAFWRARAPRERQALTLGALVVVVLLVWLALVQPAWRTLRAAPAELEALDRQIQQIQAGATEAKALRDVSPVSAPQATAALRAATDRLGDKGRLSLQGDRAVLTLTGVDADALRAWLGESRSAARARPVEASLSRASQGYSGTIVVVLGAAP